MSPNSPWSISSFGVRVEFGFNRERVSGFGIMKPGHSQGHDQVLGLEVGWSCWIFCIKTYNDDEKNIFDISCHLGGCGLWLQ